MNYSDYHGYDLNKTAFPVDNYGFNITRWFWRGPNRTKTFQLTAGIVDDMLGDNKHELPTVDFKTNKQFAAVVADFDVLPPNFNSFDEFSEFLYQTYHSACVTRSASGKVKVIFLVNNMLHLDPARTLKSLIDPSLHQYLDLSSSALTQTFFNNKMYEDITCWLKTAIPHDSLGKEFVEIHCEKIAQFYQHTISDLCNLLVANGFNTKTFRSLNEDRLEQLSVQLITSALDLCGEGVLWNQEIFAKVLGLKSPRTAAKILNMLVEVGFIEMVSNYSSGYKSRTYSATGDLLALFQHHGLHTNKEVEVVDATIKRNRLNQLIASILPPAVDANRYYLKISKYLTSYGLHIESIAKILYDVDVRRPREKRRPLAYFKSLSKWQHRKTHDKYI